MFTVTGGVQGIACGAVLIQGVFIFAIVTVPVSIGLRYLRPPVLLTYICGILFGGIGQPQTLYGARCLWPCFF